MTIHSTAVINPLAEIEEEVEIGPYCVIDAGAKIGRGTRLANHVTLLGRMTIGKHNEIYPHAVLGGDAQDGGPAGRDTELRIGDRNVIREGVVIHRASGTKLSATSIGSDCYLMSGCHIAHDVRIRDRVTLASGVMLGGFVQIHEDAVLHAGSGVHPHVTIGGMSFVAAGSEVRHDVPPYMIAEGSPARPRGANIVGLRKNRASRALVTAMMEAHRLVYNDRKGLDHAREQLRKAGQLLPQVNQFLAFLQQQQESRRAA